MCVYIHIVVIPLLWYDLFMYGTFPVCRNLVLDLFVSSRLDIQETET